MRNSPRTTARVSAGTFFVIVDPAPMKAFSSTTTGATRFGLFLAGSQMTIAVIIMLVVVLVITLMTRKFVKDRIKQGKIYKKQTSKQTN